MTLNDPFATHPPVPSFTVTSTTLAYAKTPARIEGRPVSVLAEKRTAPASELLANSFL